MVRLTRLKIDRFRNVKPGTDLRFGPTFNVLLGRNATGKSTLLDLIAAVTNDDLSAYAEEAAGFDLTWWLTDGETEIERHAMRTPGEPIPLPGGLPEQKEFDDVWTVIVRRGNIEVGRIEVVGSRGIWLRSNKSEAFDVRAHLSTPRVALDTLLTRRDKFTPGTFPWLLIFAALERVGRYDEALRGFAGCTEEPFILTREAGRGTGGYGQWLPVKLGGMMSAESAVDSLVVPLDGVEGLSMVPSVLGFASGELHPRLLQRTHEGAKTTTAYRGFDCYFRRDDGSQISHHILSFGQKRLFAFLWYLAVRQMLPVVADELLNGLHHEWIEVCFERLRDRQSFLATQHPLLLDHIPIESAESVRTTFIPCSIETDPSGREQMVWRNFDEEEAERFFVAYQTGIQHVSEILRTEGLW